jgi:Phytanoyl-CoA dioxygenase (PhyH)
MEATVLTQHQRDEFETQGLLKLPQAIPVETATQMADQTLAYLATEESIQRNRGQGWLTERPAGMQPLTRAGTFDAMADGAVPQVLDELYGPDRWKRPRHWGRALVTYKTTDQWDVPAGGWHLDGSTTTTDDPSAITVFAILAPLRPRGGGTLIVTGSHRVLRAHAADAAIDHSTKNKGVRRKLGDRHPWLRDLWSPARDASFDRRRRYLEEGAVLDGVPVRIVELTGEPGDAFLMRADLFHTPAPNALDQPRMMLLRPCALYR